MTKVPSCSKQCSSLTDNFFTAGPHMYNYIFWLLYFFFHFITQWFYMLSICNVFTTLTQCSATDELQAYKCRVSIFVKSLLGKHFGNPPLIHWPTWSGSTCFGTNINRRGKNRLRLAKRFFTIIAVHRAGKDNQVFCKKRCIYLN